MRSFLILAALLLVSCRAVNDNGSSGMLPVHGQPPVSPFQRIDSLIQSGYQDQAIRLLRAMDPSGRRDDILWRLVGAYNGRGMLHRGLGMLDSLETAGWGDLSGWKISLLDINRESVSALELVQPGDVLLSAWLSRDDSEYFPPTGGIPVPGHLGERAARLLIAPPGITPEQLMLAASDAGSLPVTVGPRVREELELASGSPGAWWEDALKLYDPGLDDQTTAELMVRRMVKLGTGDYQQLRAVFDRWGSTASAVEIARRWPERVDWEIFDALSDAGASCTRPSGDPSFSAGIRMTILRIGDRHQELISLCDSIPADAPVELKARAALFRARALRALRQNDGAYRAYSAFSADFPWHPVAREAGYLAGKYFDSEQNWGEAADAYLASLRSSGTWEGDSRGHWRGGFCLYMNGRGSLGDSLWEAGCSVFPFSYWRDEMLFWRARYANRQGSPESERLLLEQVALEHPWEFYGMLASERLHQPLALELPVVSPVVSDDPVLSQAAVLMASGYGTAATEMLAYGSCGDRALNAVALGLLGEHGLSISLLRRMDTEYRDAGIGMLPDSLLGWYFPDPYRELVMAVTDTMLLDPSYVRGIMREESYFNRFVISSAGAAGLIQLMPATASDVARWNGLPRLTPEDFFIPEHSVLYGSLYINSQARRYQHPAVFLAAYNAGPGNASRWIDMHGFDPDDQELYIEQITYRETRLYAKKVQRSAWIYGRIRR